MSRLLNTRPEGETVKAAEGKYDNYLDRVAKYMPAEIVAAYIFLENVTKDSNQNLSIAVLAGCFVLDILYFWTRYRRPVENRTWSRSQQAVHTAVSAVMFMVWAYAIGGVGFGNLRDPTVAAVLLVFASLGSGFLEPPPPEPSERESVGGRDAGAAALRP